MQPRIKICRKCAHCNNQDYKEAAQMSTLVMHVYAEWNLTKGKSKIYPTLYCQIAKETIGYTKNRKFMHDQSFIIPEGCPYILEHTVS